jgi:hypothetical protein
VRPAKQRNAGGPRELVVDVIAHAQREVDMLRLESAQLSRQRFDRRRVVGAGHAHELGLAFIAAEHRVGEVQEGDRGSDRACVALVLAPSPGHCAGSPGRDGAEAESISLVVRQCRTRTGAAEDGDDDDRLPSALKCRDQAAAG